MKLLLFSLSFFVCLISTKSYACQNGDTSKVLLVVGETEAGEENAVLGSIKTSDGTVEIEKSGYYITQSQGSEIFMKGLDGSSYRFDSKNAQSSGRFCYRVIYAN